MHKDSDVVAFVEHFFILEKNSSCSLYKFVPNDQLLTIIGCQQDNLHFCLHLSTSLYIYIYICQVLLTLLILPLQ